MSPGPGTSRKDSLLTDILIVPRFAIYVIERFKVDGGTQKASSLSYTSLLALVPLLAVSFALFAAFPAFENTRLEMQRMLFENLVPQVGSVVFEHLQNFTSKTGELTAIGTLFLFVTAIMLLITIGDTFNTVWRVRSSRKVLSRLLVFWAALTFAPLLFGASISLSSVLFAMAREGLGDSASVIWTKGAFAVPFLLQSLGFALIYLILPDYPVERRDAFVGGLSAGLMFEGLKKGFALYISHFPTYQTIYGAMAAIPIFLIWVYLSWIIVILGAEIAASLPEWRAGARSHRSAGLTAGEKLAAAVAVLSVLAPGFSTGRGIRSRRLGNAARLGPQSLRGAVEALQAKGYIMLGNDGYYRISRDMRKTCLAELMKDLGLTVSDFSTASGRFGRQQWMKPLSEQMEKLKSAERETLSTDLDKLLEAISEGAPQAHEPEETAKKRPHRKFYRRILTMVGLGTFLAGR